MIDKKIFATRLIELRTEKGIMAKEVAAAIGITKQAMSVYEKENGLPNAEKLAALADYFNVSLDYLVGRSDDPTIHMPSRKDASQ
ncbi:helix-turn-helix domain-containing protein [Aneurinibacillus aneurinilyticus]|uniref:helix-turn-helix domain-containing protein n=1 Tax=Aneurinibacillus aneurinilyticus TaxID=1391 RepID=UPI0035247581